MGILFFVTLILGCGNYGSTRSSTDSVSDDRKFECWSFERSLGRIITLCLLFDGDNVVDGYGESGVDTGVNRFTREIEPVTSRRLSDGNLILRCFLREGVFSIRGAFVNSTRFDGEVSSSNDSYPITLTRR
jgi:hypothetical protein